VQDDRRHEQEQQVVVFAGLSFVRGQWPRADPAHAVHGALGGAVALGKPPLFIHKRCGRLIETLPTLQHDPNRPEDVLKPALAGRFYFQPRPFGLQAPVPVEAEVVSDEWVVARVFAECCMDFAGWQTVFAEVLSSVAMNRDSFGRYWDGVVE
jgi:hypothetical protein